MYSCALCGKEVVVARPTGKRNRFCSKAHRLAYHNNLRLSKRQIDVLMQASKGVVVPMSHTAWALWHRDVPLLVDGGVSEIGMKFLKLALDRNKEQ